MKNITLTIVFILIAVAILWAGVWYSQQAGQANQPTQSSADQTVSGIEASTTGGNVTITTSSPSGTQTNTNSMDNGLVIKDTVVGTGATVKSGDTVNVLYTGKLDDGTVFDASSKHGNQPFTFTAGANPSQVIEGWNEGLIGMKVGGTRELTIPPDLGYGAQGAGGVIPPNATLHFTIQLLSIATGTTGQY